MHEFFLFMIVNGAVVHRASGSLVAGCLPALREAFPKCVSVVTLQGDDLFLDELSKAYRPLVKEGWRRLALQVDGVLVFARFYAEKAAALLAVSPPKFRSLPLGVENDVAPPSAPTDNVPLIG